MTYILKAQGGQDGSSIERSTCGMELRTSSESEFPEDEDEISQLEFSESTF